MILQKYVLFKRKEANIQVNSRFDNVKQKLIAVRLGYLYGSGPFRQALDGDKFKDVFYSNSTKHSIDLLLGGRIDLFVGDYLPVMHFIKEHDLYDKIDIIKESEQAASNLVVLVWPTYILFSKKTISSEYVEEVNAAMELMKKDGFFERVLERYGY